MTDISWRQARDLAAHAASRLPAVRLPLPRAMGLTLAEPVIAGVDLPPFDTAAMDGWAVRGSPPWRIVGDAHAGDAAQTLGEATAIRISTGAVVPERASVLRSEHGVEVDGLVRSRDQAPAADKDIRRRGEEITAGESVLEVGTFLTPPAIGLAAAVGCDELVAIPPPRVAVLVLGDELLRSGRPRDGKVRDALAPQLPAWLAAMGARAASVDHVPDDIALTRDALLHADCDVVITTGSTASGVADHLREAFALVGGKWLVDGVAVRPGHPMKLGVDATGRLLVALPGNPLAALSGLLTLAWPAIETLAGRSLTPAMRATITDSLACAPEASRLVPGTLTPSAHDIRASVTPAMRRGPAMLSGMSTADVMVLVEPPGVSAGDVVDVLPLPWTTGSVVPLP